MKDMEDIKIAREETDLEWQPMLDGIHAYVDLRRLGRRLAVERLMTDETIAYLTGELDRAIADVEKLTRERDEARAEVERIRAALAGEGEAKRCTWTYDETHCAWDSSCGEKWILEDGGPNENRIRFCHGCGKPVEVACEATPEKARQA